MHSDYFGVFDLYLYQFVTNSLATFWRMCVLKRPFMTYFYNIEALSIAGTMQKLRMPPESACTEAVNVTTPQFFSFISTSL